MRVSRMDNNNNKNYFLRRSFLKVLHFCCWFNGELKNIFVLNVLNSNFSLARMSVKNYFELRNFFSHSHCQQFCFSFFSFHFYFYYFYPHTVRAPLWVCIIGFCNCVTFSCKRFFNYNLLSFKIFHFSLFMILFSFFLLFLSFLLFWIRSRRASTDVGLSLSSDNIAPRPFR